MSAPEPPAFRAWVDESGSDRAQDPGTYILAAVVLETILEDDVRKTMRSMRLPGQEKLHWRDEDARRRRKIATTVATVPAHNFVVVRSTPLVLPHDPERARRKCFERLIWELAQMGVDEAVFESRGKADDRRDAAMLDSMRRAKTLPRRIHMNHVRGRLEPMLWVPDAVCGSIVELRCGNEDNYDLIASTTTLHEIN
jgi:hypothetical protein